MDWLLIRSKELSLPLFLLWIVALKEYTLYLANKSVSTWPLYWPEHCTHYAWPITVTSTLPSWLYLVEQYGAHWPLQLIATDKVNLSQVWHRQPSYQDINIGPSHTAREHGAPVQTCCHNTELLSNPYATQFLKRLKMFYKIFHKPTSVIVKMSQVALTNCVGCID